MAPINTIRPGCAPASAIVHGTCTPHRPIHRGAALIPHAAAQDAAQPSEETARFFVPGAEGEAREQLFSTISPVYDELNDELSFGLHRVWKRMTVKWSRASEGNSALDVCCGSGDIAFLLADAVGPRGQVTGLDFSAAMLQDAAARESRSRKASVGKELPCPVSWVQGDAMQLPFDPESFDAATMGYGLRNVSSIPKALAELLRVLRPGCSAAILDFNNSEWGPADSLQEFFLERLVVPAAEARGVGDEYRYLRPSIKRFPTGRQQERLAMEAGFAEARHYEIGFGTMGVLVATKAA